MHWSCIIPYTMTKTGGDQCSCQNFESKGDLGLNNYKFTDDTYTHLAFMLYIRKLTFNSLSKGIGTVKMYSWYS